MCGYRSALCTAKFSNFLGHLSSFIHMETRRQIREAKDDIFGKMDCEPPNI